MIHAFKILGNFAGHDDVQFAIPSPNPDRTKIKININLNAYSLIFKKNLKDWFF